MTPRVEFDALEPDQWFVVFHPTSASRLWGWLAFGKFKHVSAVAYCAGFKLWLLYDVELSATRIRLLPHNDQTTMALVNYMRGCTVIMMEKDFTARAPISSRLGLYCVSAIKHLLGVHCGAMRPDALYRALLRKGGRSSYEHVQSPPFAARPFVAERTAAGAAIAG